MPVALAASAKERYTTPKTSQAVLRWCSRLRLALDSGLWLARAKYGRLRPFSAALCFALVSSDVTLPSRAWRIFSRVSGDRRKELLPGCSAACSFAVKHSRFSTRLSALLPLMWWTCLDGLNDSSQHAATTRCIKRWRPRCKYPSGRTMGVYGWSFLRTFPQRDTAYKWSKNRYSIPATVMLIMLSPLGWLRNHHSNINVKGSYCVKFHPYD